MASQQEASASLPHSPMVTGMCYFTWALSIWTYVGRFAHRAISPALKAVCLTYPFQRPLLFHTIKTRHATHVYFGCINNKLHFLCLNGFLISRLKDQQAAWCLTIIQYNILFRKKIFHGPWGWRVGSVWETTGVQVPWDLSVNPHPVCTKPGVSTFTAGIPVLCRVETGGLLLGFASQQPIPRFSKTVGMGWSRPPDVLLCSQTHTRTCMPTAFICANVTMPVSSIGRRDGALPFSGTSFCHHQAVTTARTLASHMPAPRPHSYWSWATSAAQELSDHRGFAGNISPGSRLLWPLVTCFFCPATNLGEKWNTFSYPSVDVSSLTSFSSTGFQGQSKQSQKLPLSASSKQAKNSSNLVSNVYR